MGLIRNESLLHIVVILFQMLRFIQEQIKDNSLNDSEITTMVNILTYYCDKIDAKKKTFLLGAFFVEL